MLFVFHLLMCRNFFNQDPIILYCSFCCCKSRRSEHLLTGPSSSLPLFFRSASVQSSGREHAHHKWVFKRNKLWAHHRKGQFPGIAFQNHIVRWVVVRLRHIANPGCVISEFKSLPLKEISLVLKLACWAPFILPPFGVIYPHYFVADIAKGSRGRHRGKWEASAQQLLCCLTLGKNLSPRISVF